MKFSTKARYALRLMLDIVNAGSEGYVCLGDISERQRISVKYLEQIVPQLVRAGLLKSSRGPQGGYKLARNAADYTTGDIIRAIEGKIAVVACLTDEPNACEFAASCRTVEFWAGMNAVLNEYMDRVTLRDLARPPATARPKRVPGRRSAAGRARTPSARPERPSPEGARRERGET